MELEQLRDPNIKSSINLLKVNYKETYKIFDKEWND